MPNEILWMFNPGGAGEVPCCDGEGCGELCIDMEQGNPGSETPGSGITLNGGSLGTVVTDSSGRACFGEQEPGTYTFTASKTGYITNTFSVTVTEEDCDGTVIIRESHLYPDSPGSGQDIWILQCRWCPRPGVTITLSGTGWTYTAVTQSDGRLRIPLIPTSATLVNIFIPGDGGPQVDTNISVSRNNLINGVVTTFEANRTSQWHCLPHPTSNHCMIPWHTVLNITFSAAWSAPLGGSSHVLNLKTPPALQGEAEYEKIFTSGSTQYRIGIIQQWEHSNACGNRNHNFGVVQSGPVGGAFNSVFQLTVDNTYGTGLCPVNMKLVWNNSGVLQPAFYVIVVE